MAKTQILDYYIHLTDQAQAESLQAQIEAGGGADVGELLYNPQTGKHAILRAPDGAAVEFGGGTTLPLVGTNDAFVTPSIKSDWFGKGFQTNVATFTRSSGWWVFGSSTKFYWAGHVVYTPLQPEDPVTDSDHTLEPALVPQRLWVDGFEESGSSEGSAVAGTYKSARASSRTLDGSGFGFRANGTGAAYRRHDVTAGHQAWERLYIRVLRFPLTASEIYQAKYPGTTPGGMYLYVTPDGGLAVYSSAGGSFNQLGTLPGITLELGRWYQIDCLPTFTVVVAGQREGKIRVWVNKAYKGVFTFYGGGLDANFNHSLSTLGRYASTDASEIEIDYDDWVTSDAPADKQKAAAWSNSSTYNEDDVVTKGTWGSNDYTVDPPVIVAPFSLQGMPKNWIANAAVAIDKDPELAANKDLWHLLTDSPDWLVGSHVKAIEPTAFGTGHGAWGSAVVQQFWTKKPNTGTTDVPSSTTVSDPIVVTMDRGPLQKYPGQIGCGAIGVCVNSHRGTGSGQLGYDVGSGFVMAAITEGAALDYSTVFYRPPAGLTIPAIPGTLSAKYIKGADAVAGRVKSIRMMAELIGTFGAADLTADPLAESIDAPFDPLGYHNAPYLLSPWARTQQPTFGPVVIKSGTYTGNGTVTELTFPAPVHWLFVRSANAVGSMFWMSGQIGTGHPATGQGTGYEFINRVDVNPAYAPADPATSDQQTECRITITGADSKWNQNTIVYEYVAFMDPAHRFCLAGAQQHSNQLLPVIGALEDTEFLPEFGFFQKEDVSTTSTTGLWVKGQGHAAAGAQSIGTAEAASAITFGTGQLTFDSGYLTSTIYEQIAAFALFRRADGNNDAGQASVMAIGSYIGDGTASRTVSLLPSGKRPLFAIVVPATAASAFVRDPMQTTVNSANLTTGANGTTAITGGGIDSFSVGTTLNTNGVTYNYFVLLGSATAGNGGWSIDGTFIPVASDSPLSPTWAEPVVVEAEDEDGGAGGGGVDVTEEPDLSTACVAATLRLVNIALSRIGVSKVISDLVAENTMEAAIARLHIKTDVDAVLADFPWAFAKRYAELVLVGGTDDDPVNVDWQYSYRAPTDMIAARRVGSQLDLRRGYDPNPPRFETATDATGGLIFSNDVVDDDVPLVLEYTARVTCPASTGSALFKDALAWRFAASLAMPLARDSQKQAQCLAMYERVIAHARAVDANQSQKEPGGDAEWITGRN